MGCTDAEEPIGGRAAPPPPGRLVREGGSVRVESLVEDGGNKGSPPGGGRSTKLGCTSSEVKGGPDGEGADAHLCVPIGDADTGDPPDAVDTRRASAAGGAAEPLLAVSSPSSIGAVALAGDMAVAAAAAGEPKQDVVAGMLLYAASSVFFVGMAASSKALQNEGYPLWELLFFRSFVILAMSMSAIYSSGSGGSQLGQRKGLLLLRGTLGYTNISIFLAACFYLPLATATTFTFLAPLIVAVLSPWVLRETPSRAVAVVIPLCICGVVLVTQPPALFGAGAQALSAVGVMFGMLHPFVSASVTLVIRELRKTESTQVLILYLVLCTIVYSCLGCLLTWDKLVTLRSWRDAALLVSLGACGYCSQFCTTMGITKAKAASVMSMQYFSLFFSQLAGVVFFGEYTTLPQGAGMGLILASMLGYLFYEARATKPL